jgi:hypothetical protein
MSRLFTTLRSGFLALVGLLAISQQASAGAWTDNFVITNLYVAGLNNYQYRVYGMPSLSACPNGPTWAYVNEADEGSKGWIAALFLAFASGKQIRVLAEPVNGYCHIVEIFMTAS